MAAPGREQLVSFGVRGCPRLSQAGRWLLLLRLPGQTWAPDAAQRVAASWRGLLVRLPQPGPPDAQEISRAHSLALDCALRRHRRSTQRRTTRFNRRALPDARGTDPRASSWGIRRKEGRSSSRTAA